MVSIVLMMVGRRPWRSRVWGGRESETGTAIGSIGKGSPNKQTQQWVQYCHFAQLAMDFGFETTSGNSFLTPKISGELEGTSL